jgi:ATP-dependent RNA helicase DHX37/DHR1
MSKKKEKLLNKYLDKKRKQRKRDELLSQIAEIEKDREIKKKCMTNIESSIAEEDNLCDDLKDNLCDDLKNNICDEEKDNLCDDLKNNICDEEKNNLCDDLKNNICDEEKDNLCDDLKNNICDEEKDNLCDDLKNNICDEEKNNLCDDLNICDEEKNNICDEENTNKLEINDEGINPALKLLFKISELSSEDKIDTSNEEINLEDFLGENKEWKNVECSNRSEEIQDFRRSLPIFYEQSEIISKIRNYTVTYIRGETGCGKTTQIPQFLYEGGFAVDKLIGITQPRRISTLSISQRINAEMGEKVCGYHIRYDNDVTPDTKIKIMTDGILLKEIQSDFLLSKYSVILLDEIHERSANMDILISLLSRIVKIRKSRDDELKLILMSASSMNTELNKFFDRIQCIDIPSNTHKVSIFYEDKDPQDYVSAAYDRISKILKNKRDDKNNSILVLLPGKNDIYSLISKLSERYTGCTILPLHSSLSKDDQNLIYKEYDQRKIIVSTNISETSITIPDIFYVIDTGLVKNKYVDSMNTLGYSVDYISKSSALQRAGRAGRTGPGICYRLYTGQTYSKFDELDTPKIMYEPLDEIILDLLSLGIENVYKFPFVNKPSDSSIKKSINELKRLGIINANLELTRLGKCIRQLPMPPRISKILCVPGTSHILPELIDLVSLMSVNLEIRRNTSNKNYYTSEKSDLLVILKIFRDFDKENNKKEFCRRMSINLSTLTEVQKIRNYILQKFKMSTGSENILSEDTKDSIRKVLYNVYLDRIAMPHDESYWYKNKAVFLSNNSIEVDGEYVIFEYLIKGTKKVYMKNITVLDSQWFA